MPDYEGKRSVLGEAAQGGVTGGSVGGMFGATIGAGIGAIGSIKHNKKMKKLAGDMEKAEQARPTYQIPQGMIDNRNMFANAAASTRMPGQSIMEDKLNENSSSSITAAMRAGGGVSDIMAVLGAVNSNKVAGINQMGVQGAQMQAMNQSKLAQSQSELGMYQDQAFDYNKNQPYEYNLMKIKSRQGKAIQDYANGKQEWVNLAASTSQQMKDGMSSVIGLPPGMFGGK